MKTKLSFRNIGLFKVIFIILIGITKTNAQPLSATAGTPQTICIGTQATIGGNPTATGGTGSYSYSWTPVTGLDTATIANPKAAPTNSTTYTVTVTDGVSSTATDTVRIDVAQNPSPAVMGVGSSFSCSGIASLQAVPPAIGTVLWTLISGTGNITQPTATFSWVNPIGIGVNIFQLTTSNSPCPSSSCYDTITGYPSPTSPNAGNNQYILCDTFATLTGNTPTIGTGLWTLIGGTGTIVSPTSPTTLVTGITARNNMFSWKISEPPCQVNSYGQVIIYRICDLGINDLNINSEITISPDPANNIINIEFESTENEKNIIEIKNVLGQTIETITKQIVNGHNKIEIDVSDFLSGIYFIQVLNGDKVLNKKFIKE